MARLPILTFHTLADDGSVISFPPTLFVQLIEHLHSRGYQTRRLDQAVSILRGGEGPNPPAPFPTKEGGAKRPPPTREGGDELPFLRRGEPVLSGAKEVGGGVQHLVLTFDDGYQSVYQEAFPILQRYGMTATVFVTTGADNGSITGRLAPLGGRPLLAWSELREMQAAGIEIGAHTLTHPDLTRLSPQQMETELAVSKARLEDGLGVAVTSFAYPFGRYNSTASRIAQRFFHCACSDRLGLASEQSDLFALERLEMYYFRNAQRLGLLTSPWLEWYIRLRGLPRLLRRAAARWIYHPAGAQP